MSFTLNIQLFLDVLIYYVSIVRNDAFQILSAFVDEAIVAGGHSDPSSMSAGVILTPISTWRLSERANASIPCCRVWLC